MTMDKEFSRAEIDALFEESLRLYSDMKYDESAEAMFTVFEWRIRNLGVDDQATLESMHAAAYISNILGNHSEALDLYERLYELRKNKLGENHRDSLMTLHNIAFTYEKLGEYVKARDIFIDVLKVREELFGYEDRDTVATAECLIQVYSDMRDGNAEIALREKLYDIRRNSDGKIRFEPIEDLYDITAACNKYMFRLKARKYALECFLLHIKELGLTNKRTIKTLDMLSLAYIRLDEYKKSCALDRVRYKIFSELYGEKDEKTLRVLEDQGYAYIEYKDYEKAKKNYAYLSETIRGFEEPNLSLLASVEYYLARAYLGLGDTAKAKDTMEKSWRIMCEYYGEDYADTLSIKEELDNIDNMFDNITEDKI